MTLAQIDLFASILTSGALPLRERVSPQGETPHITVELEGTDTHVATSTEPQDAASAQAAQKLTFEAGFIVQEFGYDDDVDHGLRSAVEELTGTELVGEDFDEVTDAVIVWFRDDDEDLTDLLVDVQAVLEEGGPIWILTPKPGRPGHVVHNEIQEAATTAGLHTTSTLAIAEDWSATRLAPRGRSH